MTLILLLTQSTDTIHMVFDTQHLMERDIKEFGPWFEFHGLTDQVKFHVGMDFECKLGDIFLVDEADELILHNPAKFIAKIQHFKCICLTATPDNDDRLGVERQVLNLMGFSFFNG